MTLDVVAKYGVIIGTVSILVTLVMSIQQLCWFIGINMFVVDPEKRQYFISDSYITRSMLGVTVPLLGTIISSLLIYGIVKKRHWLLTPWLIVGILWSLYTTYNNSIFLFLSSFEFVSVLGAEIIVLYPICHLFLQIRQENLAKNLAAKTNYEHNLLNASNNVSASENSAVPV